MPRLFAFIAACALCAGLAPLARGAEDFKAVSKDDHASFYSQPNRNASITVNFAQPVREVSKAFMGINMSYFNTTDQMWNQYHFQDRLKEAGVGSMRYPGGAETSFFHWQHPGVNGYEDLWDNPANYGNSPGRGKFQVTWVDPAKWATNKDFQDFDEFMAACQAIGAEPLVGINLGSGRKFNRQADGIKEALEWLRYCKQKNYKVTYLFLDNEPWNGEANYTFKNDEYLDDVVTYGTAIKKEFPNVKLIINPTDNSHYNYWDWVERIINKTKSVADYIDIHWYWGWGDSSFDRWLKETPMTTGGKWTKPEWARPYGDDVRKIKELCVKCGAPNMGVTVLEWNIAPSKWSQTFSPELQAIVQAELLMEFMNSGVEMTCLWPLLWQSSRDAWPEQDYFSSIITQEPPFSPTLTLDAFRMFAPMQGSELVKADASLKEIVTSAGKSKNGERRVLFLNKTENRRRITINLDAPAAGECTAESIAVKHAVTLKSPVEKISPTQLAVYAEPLSFTAVTIH